MKAGLFVLEDAAAVAHAAADLLARAIEEAVAARGVAHVALAGGTTPRAAYEALAARALPWGAVHLWFGDERAVPPGHEASNHAMARAAFRAAALPAENVHPMFSEALAAAHADLTSAEALDGARSAYEAALPTSLDVVLLGLGPDAHVASLFPGDAALDVTTARVAIVRGAPKPPPHRLTLTPAALATARSTTLLVVGREKAPALAASLAPGADPKRTPGTLASRATILADAAAASELPPTLATESLA